MESVITRMVNCGAVEILSYFSGLPRSVGFELPDLGSLDNSYRTIRTPIGGVPTVVQSPFDNRLRAFRLDETCAELPHVARRSKPESH